MSFAISSTPDSKSKVDQCAHLRPVTLAEKIANFERGIAHFEKLRAKGEAIQSPKKAANCATAEIGTRVLLAKAYLANQQYDKALFQLEVTRKLADEINLSSTIKQCDLLVKKVQIEMAKLPKLPCIRPVALSLAERIVRYEKGIALIEKMRSNPEKPVSHNVLVNSYTLELGTRLLLAQAYTHDEQYVKALGQIEVSRKLAAAVQLDASIQKCDKLAKAISDLMPKES